MRSLTYLVACSLDGFIAAPDGSIDAFPTSDEYAAYVLQHFPETVPTHLRSVLGVTGPGRQFDTVVSGYRTYAVGPDTGHPSPYSHLEQHVVSRRLRTPPHPDIHLIADDPVAAVRRLKARDGAGIYLCGGGRLAATLVGEIDRLVLKRCPIVLGAGIPLFAGPFDPVAFAPVDCHTIDIGVSFVTYERVRA